MKKILLIAVVTIASVTAHASKARLDSLQNAAHIRDLQEVVQERPDEAVNYEAATVEFGGTTGTPNAEGGFIRKMGDAAWGLYLGRSSTTYLAATTQAASLLSAGGGATAADEVAALNSAFAQDNSLQLTYAAKAGGLNWGVGYFYVSNDFKNSTAYSSNTENLSAKKKQDIMGVLVGVNNGTWDAQLRQGLGGKTELSTITANSVFALTGATKVELNSTNSTRLTGGYKMDTMYFFGSYEMGAGELKVNGAKTAETEATSMAVGVINSHKKDGVDFFYGASYVMAESELKQGTAKTKPKSTLVPVIVGVEAEAASWLVLRGSLTQNFGLLSSSDPGTVGAKDASTRNSTVSRLGAGFKWGKADIDAALGTGSTGTFGLDDDGDNFAQMSVTYTF